MQEKRLITIDDTKFIYSTNFAGDPKRDRFGSDSRRANIIIPDVNQAKDMIDAGFNVRRTEPRDGEEEDFVPTYFVAVNLNYNSNWPPKVYLVSGDSAPVLLDEDTVNLIDGIADQRCVSNVNVVLNPYHNPNTHRSSLYVRTMYVEQDVESDPYASRYNRRNGRDANSEDAPF